MRSQLVPLDTARHATPELPFVQYTMAAGFARAEGSSATE
jgi:hypothetical protein